MHGCLVLSLRWSLCVFLMYCSSDPATRPDSTQNLDLRPGPPRGPGGLSVGWLAGHSWMEDPRERESVWSSE